MSELVVLNGYDEWDELYLLCDESKWEGGRRCCRVCNRDLPTKRHTRYCSSDCSDAGAGQHIWALARSLVKKRDGYRCAWCGARPGLFEDGQLRRDPRGRPVRLVVHHRQPVDRTFLRARWTNDNRVAGYGNGCQHHHSNLVLLCGGCHESAHASLRGKLPTPEQLAILPS